MDVISAPQLRHDDAQQQVIDGDGPMLVFGGPGTGKSTTLVERWVRLATGSGAAHRVLLLVGRREDALALRDRLPWRIPGRAIVETPVHTWHALAYHLVTRYHRLLAYARPPALLSPAEQWAVVRELLDEQDAAQWGSYAGSVPSVAFADEVADFCLRASVRLTTDDELAELARGADADAAASAFALRYRAHLRTQMRLDTAGVLQESVRLLAGFPEVREAVARRFTHVLVDDAHDLQPAQLELLGLLNTGALVCCANPAEGITEDSVGSWSDRIIELCRGGPHVTLQTTHRFGPQIRQVVDRVVARSETRGRPETAPAATSPAPPAAGGADGAAELLAFSTFAGEVEAAAREARHAHVHLGVPYEQMAVLCAHPGATVGALRQAFEALGVPCAVDARDRPLQDRPAVRWFLDAARACLKDELPDDLLAAVLGSPFGGCDPQTVRGLRRTAFRRGLPLAGLVEDEEACERFRQLRAAVSASAGAPADAAARALLDASPWAQSLFDETRDGRSSPEHAAAISALLGSVTRFVERRPTGTLSDYLSSTALSSTADRTSGTASTGVTIASIHAAHGREWDMVVVFGMTDAPLARPGGAQRVFDPWASGVAAGAEAALEALAADRQAFVTALTRARQRLIVTTSPGPSGRAMPSRLLEEGFGAVPEAAGSHLPGPLTLREVQGRLRRTLATAGALEADRAAAAAALAGLPGIDPSGWWWRRDWTAGAPPLAPSGKLTTSYSRIGTYENCPLQYVLQSVLGLDPETTYQMKFGSLVHKVIELAEDGTITTWEDALRTYKDGFDQTDYPNIAFARTYYRSGVQMLKRWWRLEKPVGTTVSVEYSFDDLDFDGHTIRGRIDRVAKIGNGLALIDYKTSRSPLSREDTEQSLQLAIYYHAARTYEDLKSHGDPASMQLVYLSYEDADPPQVARRIQRPGDADQTLGRLKLFLADAAAERFAPSPEADCQWCKMRPLCPRWPEGRETGP